MNKERLEKLANHLLTGKLGHKNFTLEEWNIGFEGQSFGPYCGTSGCAIGECPILFPENWKFNVRGNPVLIEHNYIDPWRNTIVFFDISYEQAEFLFSMFSYDRFDKTTKEEVAERILNFIKDNETLTDSQLSS